MRARRGPSKELSAPPAKPRRLVFPHPHKHGLTSLRFQDLGGGFVLRSKLKKTGATPDTEDFSAASTLLRKKVPKGLYLGAIDDQVSPISDHFLRQLAGRDICDAITKAIDVDNPGFYRAVLRLRRHERRQQHRVRNLLSEF